jgi:lactam utilization protein B
MKGMRETMKTAEEVRILVGSHPVSPKFVTEAVMYIKTKCEEKGQSITTALCVLKYVMQHVSALIKRHSAFYNAR